MIMRFVNGSFPNELSSTIAASFLNYTMKGIYDGNDVDLAIWDTAGQEAYRGIAPMYYRGAAAAVIVFDVTSRDSFEQVNGWINEVKATDENMVIAIVGNKIDDESRRIITMDEGTKLAQDNELFYCETSAKSGAGLNLLFQKIVKSLIARNKELLDRVLNKESNGLRYAKPEEENKKCCK